MAIVASSSYAITSISDGKTPYWHTAYANSADGRTGFSLTVSDGKRYMGQYTDYLSADSTDPTKYKWVDMVGTVKVGGVNLLQNSGNFKDLTGWMNYASVTSMTLVDNKIRVVSATSGIPRIANKTLIPLTSTSQELTVSVEYISSGEVTLYNKLSDSLTIFNENGSQISGILTKVSTTIIDGDRKKTIFNWKTLTATDTIKSSWLAFAFPVNITSDIINVQVEFGNVATPWRQSQEDLQSNIDSKSDSKLTQDQLNLLLETQNLMTAEMRTKATAEQVDALFASYNKYVSDESVNKANTEAALIANAERIEAFRKDYDEKMLQLDFVSNYMRATDLGLEVSASDGSSSLLVQKDRISMFSAGKEVMYISQGLIHIDNGVFTKTLQIGNFRESQADGDATTNVTIYVG